MEYKLSKSEFYRIGYLVAGILMFLFLFGIFNLSSFASTLPYITVPANTSYNWTYRVQDYNYDPADYDNPYTTISIRNNSNNYSHNNGFTISQESHLVTSEGDFVVSVNTSNSPTSFTSTVKGVPQYAYTTVFANNVSSSAVSSVSASTTIESISVGDLGNSSIVISSNFSDYDSWSVDNSLYSFTTTSSFGSDFVPSNVPFSFSFPSYSGTSLKFADVVYFAPVKGNKYKLMFDYYNQNATVDFDISLWNNNGRLRQFSNSDFVTTSYGTHKFYILEFDFSYDDSLPAFLLFYKANCSATVTSPGIAFYKRKYTIDDYMKYLKDNYNDISPAVFDTNQNIAQSVSDIGTAQSFEFSAFTDFDSSMSSSGLDTFSLSFASTPLLWCASIINTFYNNMPSGFQYLLMFVAFVGILVIVLNIAGRVVRRFGGD